MPEDSPKPWWQRDTERRNRRRHVRRKSGTAWKKNAKWGIGAVIVGGTGGALTVAWRFF
jgi:hypothetical protein